MSRPTLPDDLRAITVRQPWAGLIARGVKTIETRPRPTSYRGPVLIHASQSTKTWQELDAPTLLSQRTVIQAVLGALGVVDADGSWPSPWISDEAIHLEWDVAVPTLPLGAVVAVANLVDCVPMTAWRDEPRGADGWGHARLCPAGSSNPRRVFLRENDVLAHPLLPDEADLTNQLPYGDYRPGRYALLLEDVTRLRRPVSAKGNQAVPWRVPEDVAAAVREQVRS